MHTKLASNFDSSSLTSCLPAGVLMYEVYTKAALPYSGWNNQRVWIEVSDGSQSRRQTLTLCMTCVLGRVGYRLPAPATCPTSVYAVMKGCWETDRKKRPTFAQLEKQLMVLKDSDLQSAGCML